MSIYLIGLMVFVTIIQIYGLDQRLTTAKLKNYENQSNFVRGELQIVTGIWFNLGEHRQSIMKDVIKSIEDQSDKVTKLKYTTNQPKIKQLLKRSMDSIQSLLDNFNEEYASISSTGIDIFTKVSQEIDDARLGKSLPNNKRCNPSVVKKWRLKLRECSWHGLGVTKNLYHHLSDELESAYDSLIDASKINEPVTESDETLIRNLEDATVTMEQFLKEYKVDGETKLHEMYTTSIECYEGVSKEVNTKGSCD